MAKKITQNVNKDKIFNDLPKVDPGHSSWLTRHSNYQSCNLGQIVPVYWDEVLPNEKREVTMGMISHTVTPVAPIFNALYTEFRSFFVPMRLAADLLNGYKTRKSPWVKVFGEDNASSNANIIVPLSAQKLPDCASSFISDLNTYLSNTNSADNILDSLDLKDDNDAVRSEYNFLQLAAYELIYQRHYRNENYESATASNLYRVLFDAYNPSRTSVSLSTSFSFHTANREKDYFTGMKPYTLKASSPISINVGTKAYLKADAISSASDMHDLGNNLQFAYKNGTTPTFPVQKNLSTGNSASHGAVSTSSASIGANEYEISMTNLYADLTTAQGLSIEQLRLLIKTQELLEKDSMYGSFYAESLNAHFGTCPLDLTLQDPQEIYKVTITSQMQAIFQTSTTTGEATILGTIGANSTTQTDPFVIVPEVEFKEHGILMICAVHKLQNVYDSTWYKPKFLTKKSRFDFYTPELDALGYQPVSNQEMLCLGGGAVVAGFNEAFAEYRYKFNKSHGKLNLSYQYWAPAIASEYASASALYKEGETILDKALSVASKSSAQFFDAYGFEEKNTKPMSLHSIPGFDGVI